MAKHYTELTSLKNEVYGQCKFIFDKLVHTTKGNNEVYAYRNRNKVIKNANAITPAWTQMGPCR